MKYTVALFMFFIYSCSSNVKPRTEHLARLEQIKGMEIFTFLDNLSEEERLNIKPLLQLYYKDQLYRDAKNYEYYKANKLKQDLLDSENQLIVARFLDSTGFPSKKEVGYLSAHNIALVLEHAPLMFKEKYAPLMNKALQKGDVSPSQYAIFIDKILWKKKQLQKYGTQVIYQNKSYSLYPVNLATVATYRKEINMLEPLEYYLEKNFKIKLDSSAYMKELPASLVKYKIDTTVNQ